MSCKLSNSRSLITNTESAPSGWIPNYDLVDLDFEEVGNISTTMRKDLAAAHELAAERHDLNYFKDILKNFMEARETERAAKEAAKAEKKAKKAAAKKEKKTAKVVEEGEDDEDVDMADAPGEADSEEPGMVEAEEVNKKKRKSTADDVSYSLCIKQVNAEFAETPQRDPVKKPRPNIKLTTSTPKATNGTATPKSAKEQSATKSTKPKTKKSAPKAPETPEVIVPKEPELTAEDKRAKKEVS
jgi:flagellar basal body rod protein FlgC